jgi:hypothetical protein
MIAKIKIAIKISSRVKPGAGCLMLDAGYWILDAGYWILDAGYWILDVCFMIKRYNP